MPLPKIATQWCEKGCFSSSFDQEILPVWKEKQKGMLSLLPSWLYTELTDLSWKISNGRKYSYYPVFLSIWKNHSYKWSLINAHLSISSRDRLIRHLYVYGRGRRDYVNSIFPKKQNLTQSLVWQTAYVINGYVCLNSNNYQRLTPKVLGVIIGPEF